LIKKILKLIEEEDDNSDDNANDVNSDDNDDDMGTENNNNANDKVTIRQKKINKTTRKTDKIIRRCCGY